MTKREFLKCHNDKNAVVVIAIGQSERWNLCRLTIKKYCEKFNLPLIIIKKKKYHLPKFETIYGFNFFEKNQVYDLFNKYERILRLDWDVIITPECPNLFNIIPEDKIGVVFEDVGTRMKDRRKRIKIIQKTLGDVNWKDGYINTGVILTSKIHKEIFHTSIEDMEQMEKLKLKVSKEQNFFNYLVRKLNFEIFSLDFKYNHVSLFSEPWNGCANKFKSYIIHYAGNKARYNKFMILNDINYVYFNRKKSWNHRIIIEFIKRIWTIKDFLKYLKKISYKRNLTLYEKKTLLIQFIKNFIFYLNYW